MQLEFVSANPKHFHSWLVPHTHPFAANWNLEVLYEPNSISGYMVCYSCLYNPIKGRVSNQYLWWCYITHSAREWVKKYIFRLSAITSEVTNYSTVKTCLFNLFPSTTLTPWALGGIGSLWGFSSILTSLECFFITCALGLKCLALAMSSKKGRTLSLRHTVLCLKLKMT